MRTIAALLILSCVVLPTSAQTNPGTAKAAKKLIEFGWDEPDTAFMRKHIHSMEQTPFDGTVFHITYQKADGTKGSFMNDCWGRQKFELKQVSAAVEDLKATPLKTFTHNFLRFNVCPGDVDWFDDFSAITANAALAAQVAKEGKAAGVLFDIEEYSSPLFDYQKQKLKDAKSFDEYAKQAYLRGQEVMTAFQKGYPDLTVFLTFGYSLPYAQLNGTAAGVDQTKLSTVDYGLLKPFLDGMFSVAAGKAKIVDGFEISYPYKSAEQFAAIPKEMNIIAEKFAADGKQFREHGSLGFGLWMDQDWRKNGWDVNDSSKNFFTPAQFEKSIHMALESADEYVWIYTEEPRWWAEPDGKPLKLPPAYSDAVRKSASK